MFNEIVWDELLGYKFIIDEYIGDKYVLGWICRLWIVQDWTKWNLTLNLIPVVKTLYQQFDTQQAWQGWIDMIVFKP